MNEYLKAQNKTNQLIMENVVTTNETDRFAKADSRWAVNRKNQNFSQRHVKKGDIYQFEFGKNYKPEISYEHRGLIIGISRKLLYVLPIFSYDPVKYDDVYHPEDYPNSKSDFYLLKNEEFPFIVHDSVLKLNDIRTVSINRILYQQHDGHIGVESDTYKQIIDLVFHKYFPDVYYQITSMKKELDHAQNELSALRKELNLSDQDSILDYIKEMKESSGNQ